MTGDNSTRQTNPCASRDKNLDTAKTSDGTFLVPRPRDLDLLYVTVALSVATHCCYTNVLHHHMSKNCFTCNVRTVLKCCIKCQAVQYCSKSCQKQDWKQHKQICQFLNAGDGAMQVQTDEHVDGYVL